MIAQELSSERLLLDQPTAADIPLITEYCQDALFERFMTLPWPYERKHAEYFVNELVPNGWATDAEYTWAVREAAGGELLGVIGARTTARDLGYWLGTPHREQGYMTEAVSCVVTWLFGLGWNLLSWECVEGNRASASVARKNGFRFTGTAPSHGAFRDGSHPASWHGLLGSTDERTEKPGWP
jgi:RimJ/RimL family protein N-acetyltransferase